jgi:hypothetical protein
VGEGEGFYSLEMILSLLQESYGRQFLAIPPSKHPPSSALSLLMYHFLCNVYNQ